jgi:hypothetical protein
MAQQTGRTVGDFTSLLLGIGGAMQPILIDTLGDVGLDYPEEEMSAFQDAIKGVLVGKPDFTLTFGGPFSDTTTTGTHTILNALVGVMSPIAFDVQVGIRHAWEAGEPQFGITGTAANGCIVTSYKVTGGKYTSTLRMYPGSAAPAWGVAAEASS